MVKESLNLFHRYGHRSSIIKLVPDSLVYVDGIPSVDALDVNKGPIKCREYWGIANRTIGLDGGRLGRGECRAFGLRIWFMNLSVHRSAMVL